MPLPHETLAILPTATAAQAKAAYHLKLREFPAHTHPVEFKAVRAAYEAFQKGSGPPVDDFFKMRRIQDPIEPELLKMLQDGLIAQVTVSLEDMLRETF